MTTQVYIGSTPSNIQAWISSHVRPREETRFWWSDDPNDYDDYLIEGTFERDCISSYGKQLSNAVKVDVGAGSQANPLSVIGYNAFNYQNKNKLEKITMHSNVLSIANGAFQYIRRDRHSCS